MEPVYEHGASIVVLSLRESRVLECGEGRQDRCVSTQCNAVAPFERERHGLKAGKREKTTSKCIHTLTIATNRHPSMSTGRGQERCCSVTVEPEHEYAQTETDETAPSIEDLPFPKGDGAVWRTTPLPQQLATGTPQRLNMKLTGLRRNTKPKSPQRHGRKLRLPRQRVGSDAATSCPSGRTRTGHLVQCPQDITMYATCRRDRKEMVGGRDTQSRSPILSPRGTSDRPPSDSSGRTQPHLPPTRGF